MRPERRNNGFSGAGAGGENESVFRKVVEKINGWRLGITVDGETLVKAGLIALLMILFTLFQTTLFTRFRPFGAIPDLLLPFVLVVGIKEKEKWGAVVALIAAFVIDAAGGTTVTLLPLLYVPATVACALLTTNRLRDSLAVNAMFTLVASAARSVISLFIIMTTVNGITLSHAVTHHVLPEFAANCLVAVFPQLITRAALRPFHKTRAERTGEK